MVMDFYHGTSVGAISLKVGELATQGGLPSLFSSEVA
jgi:hypothetical protein